MSRKDFMAEVRKKWIYAGRECDESGKFGLLVELLDGPKAWGVWERVSYVAKAAAGIGQNKTPTLEQQERARLIAERLLQVIYEEYKAAEEET